TRHHPGFIAVFFLFFLMLSTPFETHPAMGTDQRYPYLLIPSQLLWFRSGLIKYDQLNFHAS
ncbi:MAG: hypothetical protein WD267_12970, partial [Balneolales bacterium]